MAYRWPTDPAGKPASHAVSWQQHQANLAGKKPAAPQPVPSAGGVPATPVVAPPDPLLLADMANLEATKNQGFANLQQQRTQGLANYGFIETPFDTGSAQMGALAFDPNNPFSRAALLKKTYDTSRQRAGNTMAAGGQLYAGAYQNQQDLVNRGQLQDEDALQKSLTAFLAANTAGRVKTATDYEQGAISAKAQAAGRAADSPLYAPTIPDAAPAPAAPAGGTSSTSTTKKPSTKKTTTIKAGPNVKPTKSTTVSKKRKGRTVTYTTSVKGP